MIKSGYRSSVEIISQVLDVANGSYGMTKTMIMYKAFLSYTQVKEYVKILTEDGLLSYDSGTQTYKTTERGLRFIQVYNQIDDVINEQPLPQQQQQ